LFFSGADAESRHSPAAPVAPLKNKVEHVGAAFLSMGLMAWRGVRACQMLKI